MRIELNDIDRKIQTSIATNNGITIFDVFSRPVVIKRDEGTMFSIFMKNYGFEFTYAGVTYVAENGIVRKVEVVV